jgi:hypothetical protein
MTRIRISAAQKGVSLLKLERDQLVIESDNKQRRMPFSKAKEPSQFEQQVLALFA